MGAEIEISKTQTLVTHSGQVTPEMELLPLFHG